jgi:hypothetical protein
MIVNVQVILCTISRYKAISHLGGLSSVPAHSSLDRVPHFGVLPSTPNRTAYLIHVTGYVGWPGSGTPPLPPVMPYLPVRFHWNRIRIGWSGFVFRQVQEFSSMLSRPGNLGPTKPSIKWVPMVYSPEIRWYKPEADQLPPSRADFKNAWRFTFRFTTCLFG